MAQTAGPAEQPPLSDGGLFVDYASPTFPGPFGAVAGGSPAKKHIVKRKRSQNWQIPAFATVVGLLLVVGVATMALKQKEAEEKERLNQVELARKAQLQEERVRAHRARRPSRRPAMWNGRRGVRNGRRRRRRRGRTGRTSLSCRREPNPQMNR